MRFPPRSPTQSRPLDRCRCFVSRPATAASAKARNLAMQVLAGTETVSELARQHEVSRKFLYQQVHTAEKAAQRSLRTLKSTRRRPLLPAGHQGLAAATGPGLGARSAIVRTAAWSNCCVTSSIIGSPWGPCTTSCTAPLLMPGESTSSTTSPPSSSRSSSIEIFQAAAASRLGGGRCRLHLLLLAESGRASRRRYLGHPAAGTGRPGLRSPGHHRRFRRGAPRRAPGGPA